MAEPITVVIPAHNEARVIGASLHHLLGAERQPPTGWRIMVAANGCTDATAQIVRNDWPGIDLLELPVPSKVNALRAAMTMIPVGPVIILDADIRVTLKALRALVAPLVEAPGAGGPVATIGRFDPDVTASDLWVRLFYRVWRLHPYFDGGKFGGCYALAARAQPVIASMPDVINDDEYVARSVAGIGTIVTTGCVFATPAPRHVGELIRVRSRVQRGNRQLQHLSVTGAISPLLTPGRGIKVSFIRRLLMRPMIWPAALVYLGVNTLARLRNRLWHRVRPSGDAAIWERVSR